MKVKIEALRKSLEYHARIAAEPHCDNPAFVLANQQALARHEHEVCGCIADIHCYTPSHDTEKVGSV